MLEVDTKQEWNDHFRQAQGPQRGRTFVTNSQFLKVYSAARLIDSSNALNK